MLLLLRCCIQGNLWMKLKRASVFSARNMKAEIALAAIAFAAKLLLCRVRIDLFTSMNWKSWNFFFGIWLLDVIVSWHRRAEAAAFFLYLQQPAMRGGAGWFDIDSFWVATCQVLHLTENFGKGLMGTCRRKPLHLLGITSKSEVRLASLPTLVATTHVVQCSTTALRTKRKKQYDTKGELCVCLLCVQQRFLHSFTIYKKLYYKSKTL